MRYEITLEELIDAIGGTEYCKAQYYYDCYCELGEAMTDLIEGCETQYYPVIPLDLEEIYNWCIDNCEGD